MTTLGTTCPICRPTLHQPLPAKNSATRTQPARHSPSFPQQVLPQLYISRAMDFNNFVRLCLKGSGAAFIQLAYNPTANTPRLRSCGALKASVWIILSHVRRCHALTTSMSVLMSMACLRVLFPEVRLHSLHDCSAHHCIRAAGSAGAELLMCVAGLCRVLPEVRLHILCDR